MAFNPVGETQEVLQKFEQLSTERKQAQADGIVPEWYTTQSYQMFKEKYAVGGEALVKGRHQTIAKTLARHMVGDEAEWEAKFFDLMWRGILSPASPVLSNTGTNKGMPVSCSGQFVGDSIESFYGNLKETAILSKNGFGTSADFSSIRPRGEKISTGGSANGPVPVIDDFFTCASKVSQGGSRRGSVAAYLDIEHPDWDEAIDSLLANPDGKNYGWTIRDSFIERLKSGDEDANRRFKRALHVKLVTGKGYAFFVDKANRHRPQMYKDLGLDIKASNLCVAPETVILTNKGHKKISELVDQDVTVWNGEEWSETKVVKTGENQKLLTVLTDSGSELTATEYHKWYVQDDYSKNSIREVRTHELKPGDKLIKWTAPVIEGEKELTKAYQNGFYSGDGCEVNGKSRVYLYGDKRNLIDSFPDRIGHYVQENQDREYFYVDGLKSKFFVPSAEYTIASRLEWLAGYLDSDGCVALFGDSLTLQAASINLDFLKEIQLMLQTVGVQSKIKMAREECYRPMPDGRGGVKDYLCKASYRILISGDGVVKLVENGIKFHRLEIPSGYKPQRNAERFVKVVEVVDNYRIDDTYCFSELKRHMGVFNGILTGQCVEIMLHSSDELSFSCILSSLNLVHWDKIKNSNAAFDSMVFLDCLCSEFIEKSEGIVGLEKVREFTIKGRATGLGYMGFATYLQSQQIPYASLQASWFNNEVFEHLEKETLRASKWLAERFGEPEWCKGYGVRNTHRTAIAPTKSTSLLMGGVSESVFPDPAMVFDAGSAVGELRRITPVIYELMKEKGVYSAETIADIIDHVGSVQHVDWLTDDEKAVFLTAFEIPQDVILRYASRRQRYLCQGQSLNFYVPEDGSEKLISDLMTKVYLDENILSQYYIYSRSGVVIKDECISCAA